MIFRLVLALVVALAALAVGVSGASACGSRPCPPPPVEPPPSPPVRAVGFCVQTTNRGWSYVQAYAGAFDPGRPWRVLYDAAASVAVAGHVLRFAAEGSDGIVVAPVVPGVGATCDQPWVSNDTPPRIRTR